tara:strand:- start:302 stop:565 length:264 start_codon:yes stop_codon:yes gene_type:complete
LGRKKCLSPTCKKQVDKPYLYCYKCNKDFTPKETKLPKGFICLIDSDDDETITYIVESNKKPTTPPINADKIISSKFIELDMIKLKQ